MKRAPILAPILSLGLAALAIPAMAQNASQVAAVKAGAKACPGCNLFQLEMPYADISGRNFAKAKLRQGILTVVEADRTSFAGANLSLLSAFGARFSGANFTNADLSQGVFVGAYFGGANMKGATLTGANFGGAEMAGAKGLTQAQLNDACGDASTELPPGLTIPACGR